MIGTIQYIENFFEILKKVNFEKSSYVYLSRSIFSSFDSDYFSVQKITSESIIEQSIKIHSLDLFVEKMKKKILLSSLKEKMKYSINIFII